jgi:phosphoserine phosphatase RsbU/P
MPDSAPRTFALLLAHDGSETKIAAQAPFTIGRSPQMDLVLPYPYISRQHAEVRLDPESQSLELVCLANNECFVNGARVTRHKLAPGDEIRLGFQNGPLLRFSEEALEATSLRAALVHLKQPSGTNADLAKLSWFVEAARRLNNVGAVQEICAALIDTTLELTRVERGYVFLREPDGKLRLAAGRSLGGGALEDGSTISYSALQQAIDSGSDFIVTDTLSAEAIEPSMSVVVQNIRAIICIPLRQRSSHHGAKDAQVIGVLYLDSQRQRSRLTRLDNDLLRTIATEATLLVENAALVEAEAAARRYREELAIAHDIQQGLMSVRTPNPSFAQLEARNVPCTGIGGDFYDVLCNDEALYVVVADISGKGVSAAVLGSALQGLIHGQILSGLSLSEIALFANQYICRKNIRKYATLILLRLAPDGTAEYINCGHVQPLVHSDGGASPGTVAPATNCNLPVGLLADAVYTSETLHLTPAQRIFVLTDGVTEAEDPSGRCFGDGRLPSLIAAGSTLTQIFAEINAFTAGVALEDDCTMVEVRYRPKPAAN